MLSRAKVRAVLGGGLSAAAEALWDKVMFRVALCEEDATNDGLPPALRASAVSAASELFLAVYWDEAVLVTDRTLLLIILFDLAPVCHRLWAELYPDTFPRCAIDRNSRGADDLPTDFTGDEP